MAKSINDIPKKKRGRPATGKGEGVLVRLQPDQLKALDSWIAKQDASLTRPEAIRAMMETILSHPVERHGREAGQEGEDPMKESTLSKITASVAVAKRMAQGALAASPNPQWTEYEMQSVDEWIARQGVKLDRSEAIRRLVEIGLKAK
jgi:metal-responsive CopG/Arc/MetJ family transcriptional regulator